MTKIKISPSLLSADFSMLGKEVERISKSGADMIHIDVMDGNFVPNLTIGADVIKSIKNYSTIPLDVHLMINNPGKYIQHYLEAGADFVTFHIEAARNHLVIKEIVSQIKAQKKNVGIALKPDTNLDLIKDLIEEIDLLLIMTVEPGFGGQKFMENQLVKISYAKRLKDSFNKNLIISVDGGINKLTSAQAINAGADMLVSGSYLLSQNNLKDAVENLRRLS